MESCPFSMANNIKSCVTACVLYDEDKGCLLRKCAEAIVSLQTKQTDSQATRDEQA